MSDRVKPKVVIEMTEEEKTKFMEEWDVSSMYPQIIVPREDIEILMLEKTVNQLCKEAYEIAKSKGWHDESREMGTVLALVHSEVSEALEADRIGDRENFIEELADVCIRIFDLCGSEGIDLGKAIEWKMEVNRGREYKHGKNY